MKFRALVATGLACIYASHGLAQQSTKEVELETDTANSSSKKAKVIVSPRYLSDPDGAGLDAWTDRDLGLVGRWDFEDSLNTGPFADASAYNNTLTLTAGQSQAGGVSKSIALNGGSNVYTTLSDNPSSGTGKITVSTWFRINSGELASPNTSTKKFSTLFHIDEYFAGNKNLAVSAAGVNGQQFLTVRLGEWGLVGGQEVFYHHYVYSPLGQSAVNGTAVYLNYPANAVLDDDKWNHLVFTYNKSGGDVSIYLNGTKITANGFSALGNGTNENLKNKYIRFGHVTNTAQGAPIYFLNGNIDRIRLYNREISQAEVTLLANQNADGDAVTDRNELLQSSDPLDANDPSGTPEVARDDDQNLPSEAGEVGDLGSMYGRWDFETYDENSKVADLTNYHNDLEPVGGVLLDRDKAMPSSSVALSGQGYLKAGNISDWGNVDEFTSSVWVRFDEQTLGTSTRTTIFSLNNAFDATYGTLNLVARNLLTGGSYLELVATTDVTAAGGQVSTDDVRSWTASFNEPLDDGEWHHVALVRRAGIASQTYVYEVFLDGSSLGIKSDFNQGDFDGSSRSLYVGGFDNAVLNNQFKKLSGNLDRLRFYNHEFTVSQVGQLRDQDWDIDHIPDYIEVASQSLNPLVVNGVAGPDPTWDQDNLDVGLDSGLLAHWNFESFRYSASGVSLENQANPGTFDMMPSTTLTLGSSNAIASSYAHFRGGDEAEASLGSALNGQNNFSIAGWMKIKRDSVYGTSGTPTPLFEIHDAFSGGGYDSVRMFAQRAGMVTHVYLTAFDNSPSVRADSSTINLRWILPPSKRIDDENWHHLALIRKNNGIGSNEYQLYLNGVPVEEFVAGSGASTLGAQFNGSQKVFRIGKMERGADPGVFSYGFNGCIDRVRLYSRALSVADISALHTQDADGDGVADKDEYFIPGRSAITVDSGTLPSGALDNVDLLGVPPSLNDDPKLIGFWDFEELEPTPFGFKDWTSNDRTMVPHGAPEAIGIDDASGMPSKSVFISGRSYLDADGTPLIGSSEFSVSVWVKTEAGILNTQKNGISLVSFEDMMPWKNANILNLKAIEAGGVKSLALGMYDSNTGLLKVAGSLASWPMTGTQIDDGRWHHISWVRGKGGSLVYLDGVQLERNSIHQEIVAPLEVTNYPGSSPRIVLGQTSVDSPLQGFKGNIDRLRIYKRALSSVEVGSFFQQDFDGDGFTDLFELGRLGFDPVNADAAGNEADGNTTDLDDDTGLTNATTLENGLLAAWNFETLAPSEVGDSQSTLRFPAQRPTGVASALADVNARWDRHQGMLSRSLTLARDSRVAFPATIWDDRDKVSASFWIRMEEGSIDARAGLLEVPGNIPGVKDKIALLTFGGHRIDLPKLVLSVNGKHQLVLESGFARIENDPNAIGYTNTQILRTSSPSKLDDGRWHHVVVNVDSKVNDNDCGIIVDGKNAPILASPNYGFSTGSVVLANEPYLWMGYKKNLKPDTGNYLVSQLSYVGFDGNIDRVRFYKRTLSSTEAGDLYKQDYDQDTIWDVTEVNGTTDPTVSGVVNAGDDLDNDGLTKAEEDTLGTDWRDPDSDGDWLSDGWENLYTTGADSLRPMRDDSTARDQDQDSDTLTAWQEFLIGTDPDDADTDNDTHNDNIEMEKGSDPLLLASTPGAEASGTAMYPGPSGGQLPGGTYQLNFNDGIARSITYNGSDATGPRHRKIALNGRPIADEAPEDEGETDQNKEEMYVDAFSLGLHYDTSVVYVPVPSSRLTLQATLSLREESWSHRSGIRPNEKITNPFGPCWTSNLCAYVQETRTGDINYDPDKPAVTFNIVDEDGRGMRFGSYDGRRIFAYPSSLTDRRSYTHEMGRGANDTLVLRKKHGTVLTYELTTLKQSHVSDRAGQGANIVHRYYRLSTVRDRYGNELRYVYPGTAKNTLIPSKIIDPKRESLALTITLVPGNPHRIESVTDPRGHTHTFSYTSVTVPNGSASDTAAVQNTLSGITDPYQKTINYGYQAVYDKQLSNSVLTHHYHVNLSSITDKRGVVSNISYRPDDARYTTTQGQLNATYNRIHGLPRLVSKVTSAAQNTATLNDNTNVSRTAVFRRRAGIRWLYGPSGVTITSGGNAFVPTRDWFNEITDALGNKTTYCFRNIKAHATNVDNHGSSLSLNWMVYYLQMDIILPGGLGVETYNFDLASGLNVASSKDLSGNSTHYKYGDSWGGFSIIPSKLSALAIFSRWSDPTQKTDGLGRVQNYTYSQHYRAMSSHRDVFGTLRTFTVDTLGRRTSLEARDKNGTLLRRETYKYENAEFPSFMTSQRLETYANLSGHAWEKPIITLREADSQGRVAHEGVDLNQNGQLEPGTDIVTSFTYDKNNNKVSSTDPNRNTTDFSYDKLNRLSRVHYPAAEGVARDVRADKILFYDANSNKVAEQDEEGNFSITIYDALNRGTKSVRDMDGVGLPTFASETTADGQQVYKLTNEGSAGAADIVSGMSYNAVDSATHATDPRGIVTYTEFDAIQRPVKIWVNWSEGNTEADFTAATDKTLTIFEYDSSQNTGGSIFNKDGFKPTKTISKNAVSMGASGAYQDVAVEQEYDKVYRPTRTTLSYAPGTTTVSLTEYNDAAYTVQTTAALGEANEKTTLTEMDGLGRPVQVTDGFGSGLTATVQTFYTSTGLAWKVIDPEGRESETDYDTAARPEYQWQPANHITDKQANGYGKVDRTNVGHASQGSPRIQTIYDLNSNVVATINPLGKQWDTAFDARNRPYQQQQPAVTNAANPASPVANQRPTTTTLYNKVGKAIAVQDARGSWSRSFYDRAYRVIFTRINPSTGSPSAAPDPGTNNAFDIVTSTVFDKNGNPIAVTDGNGNITRNAFDALNRQITTAVNPSSGNPTDPNGNGYTATTYQLAAGIAGDIVTTTLYDDAGNVVRITDGQGRTLDYRYDGLKRKTHTIWDIGTTLARTEILTYNGVLQTSRTDANGRITNYAYDSLHRLTSVTYPSRTQDNRTNSYDLANNILSVSYPNESASNKLRRQCASEYDALNRVISETSNEVGTTTSFDKAGNILTKVYGQTNRTIVSQYDALNRLAQCTEGTRITHYAFDLNGNITRKTLPNGQYTDKTFDKLNRTVKSLTKTLLGVLLVSTDSTAAVAPYSNGYDNVGSLLKTTEQYAHASVKDRILTNSYDKAYRLTQEILDQSGAGGTVQTTDYQYDRSNNRHRKTTTVGASVTEDYEHNYGDGDNGANSHQLVSFGPWGGTASHTFTYDANGSRLTMVTAGRTDTYLYDDEKRLVSLDYQTDADANKRGLHLYQYDHRTRRVSRNESAVSGGADTRLVFASGLSVQEHGASITSSPAVEYIRGSDYGGGVGGVLYTLRSGTPRYNAYNHRGDVTTTTDSSAAINWQAAYEAFGKRTQEQGTNPERQRANTKDEDPTGLLNEGMRYRDLLTGTFITRDPLGPVDGPNEYTYVKQSPWSSFDPDGLAGVAIGDGEVSATTDDQIPAKKTKKKKRFIDRHSVDPVFSARENLRKQIDLVWERRFDPKDSKGYQLNEQERGLLASKLGDAAWKGGLRDKADEMWTHKRRLYKEERKTQIKVGLVTGLVDAGVTLATSITPVPFDDAANAARLASTSTNVARRSRLALPYDATVVPYQGGTIRSFVTSADDTYYRVFSGENKIGGYLTKNPPRSQAWVQEALALPPWNRADYIQKVAVPAGTRLQRSRALGNPWGRGGAEQFELLNKIPDESFGAGTIFR